MAARNDSSAVEFRRRYIPVSSSEHHSYRDLLCSPRLDCSWSGMNWKALEISSFLLQWSALPKKKNEIFSSTVLWFSQSVKAVFLSVVGGLIPVRYFLVGSIMVKEKRG